MIETSFGHRKPISHKLTRGLQAFTHLVVAGIEFLILRSTSSLK